MHPPTPLCAHGPQPGLSAHTFGTGARPRAAMTSASPVVWRFPARSTTTFGTVSAAYGQSVKKWAIFSNPPLTPSQLPSPMPSPQNPRPGPTRLSPLTGLVPCICSPPPSPPRAPPPSYAPPSGVQSPRITGRLRQATRTPNLSGILPSGPLHGDYRRSLPAKFSGGFQYTTDPCCHACAVSFAPPPPSASLVHFAIFSPSSDWMTHSCYAHPNTPQEVGLPLSFTCSLYDWSHGTGNLQPTRHPFHSFSPGYSSRVYACGDAALSIFFSKPQSRAPCH